MCCCVEFINLLKNKHSGESDVPMTCTCTYSNAVVAPSVPVTDTRTLCSVGLGFGLTLWSSSFLLQVCVNTLTRRHTVLDRPGSHPLKLFRLILKNFRLASRLEPLNTAHIYKRNQSLCQFEELHFTIWGFPKAHRVPWQLWLKKILTVIDYIIWRLSRLKRMMGWCLVCRCAEFRLSLTSDQNRIEQLLSSLAHKCHPLSKFMWGQFACLIHRTYYRVACKKWNVHALCRRIYLINCGSEMISFNH